MGVMYLCTFLVSLIFFSLFSICKTNTSSLPHHLHDYCSTLHTNILIISKFTHFLLSLLHLQNQLIFSPSSSSSSYSNTHIPQTQNQKSTTKIKIQPQNQTQTPQNQTHPHTDTPTETKRVNRHLWIDEYQCLDRRMTVMEKRVSNGNGESLVSGEREREFEIK